MQKLSCCFNKARGEHNSFQTLGDGSTHRYTDKERKKVFQNKTLNSKTSAQLWNNNKLKILFQKGGQEETQTSPS